MEGGDGRRRGREEMEGGDGGRRGREEMEGGDGGRRWMEGGAMRKEVEWKDQYLLVYCK